MSQVFSAAKRFVIIYSSNTDTQFAIQGEHIRHRKFTDWVATNQKNWKLVQEIPNRYPYTGDDSSSSFADFYIYQRVADI